MSLRERASFAFAGTQASPRRSMLVIARYALQRTFASKLFLAFYLACFVPALGLFAAVYAVNTVDVLAVFGVEAPSGVLGAEGWLFPGVVRVALVVVFLIVLAAGPALISPDVGNQAMPLILSRPLTRLDYALGKLLALVALAAVGAWLPGMAVLTASAFYADDAWAAHARAIGALSGASLLWTLALGLAALAISACVKWRPAATLGFLGIYFVAAAFGQALAAALGLGANPLSLADAIDTLAAHWLRAGAADHAMPVAGAWSLLLGVAALAALVLSRRIRAFEAAR